MSLFIKTNTTAEARLYQSSSDTSTFLLNFRLLQKFPKGINGNGIKFKRSRSRMMLDAIRSGYSLNGNIGVLFENFRFIYSYRGTNILMWNINLDLNGICNIDTKIYEKSSSTINQRKQAIKAIEEFRVGVALL